jgi:hypothetical protein
MLPETAFKLLAALFKVDWKRLVGTLPSAPKTKHYQT